MVRNLYFPGEPFPEEPKAKRPRAEKAPEPEEELAELELERRRNIERNKELLRQLGLA